jgi:hypothetical protein
LLGEENSSETLEKNPPVEALLKRLQQKLRRCEAKILLLELKRCRGRREPLEKENASAPSIPRVDGGVLLVVNNRLHRHADVCSIMNSARRKVREVEFRKNNEGLQMFLCLPEGVSAIRNAIITAVDSFDQD